MKQELTEAQIEFLKILESFMRGKEYHFPNDFTAVKELWNISANHKMVSAVYEQTRSEELFRREECAAYGIQFKRATVHETIMQIQRSDGFLRVYKKMCEQGVKPLVVKGLICRNLYDKPDYRVSGDEDILIRPEDFAVCDEVLLREGFRREECPGEDFRSERAQSEVRQSEGSQSEARQDEGSRNVEQRVLTVESLPQEVSYIQPQSGVYIEVHLALFPESSGAYGHLNKEFEAAHETAVSEEIRSGNGVETVWTLEPTLHLFYLICHSFKHFLHSGFGIRQVCDMVMMAEHYGGKIDWKYINGRMEALRMRTFWDGLAEIGKRYLGFSYEKAHYPEFMQRENVRYESLLTDLMCSGIYGASSMERKHSSNMTLAAAEKGEKSMTASMGASLFPGREYMQKGYPWLKKYPWLLPAAWGMRISNYLKNSKNEKSGEANSVEIGMNRVELLREYHIIE